ncbi:MAG: hypothetical protein WC979_03190 [Candidatus Pacearchaeota archaeon]|jgi:hypothetical protein|nr:hypothetical protein [Clostridia bacterium]
MANQNEALEKLLLEYLLKNGPEGLATLASKTIDRAGPFSGLTINENRKIFASHIIGLNSRLLTER